MLPNHPHSLSYPFYAMDPSAVDFRAFYPYTPNEVKHRKRTTSAQLKVLESIFKRDTKPNAALRNELAIQLDMTARGVQVWFQNRRAKEKSKATKSATASSTDSSKSNNGASDAQDPAESAIIPPTATFPRDLPELEPSSSQGSSPTGNSPPHLHVSCDSNQTSWNGSPLATPDDFNQSADFSQMYMIRRGSLPVDMFPVNEDCSRGPPLVGHFDPFIRRRSVDASLHRLANNPFANLARVKNGMAGTRLSGLSNEHFRMSSAPQPPLIPEVPMLSHSRHSSADSRTFRFPPTGVPVSVSPSPSPLSPYNVVRSSLPDNQLYAFSHRQVPDPIPGPLPSPDFSFGVANHSSVSLTSPSSERNSPDHHLHGFVFRDEEIDTEDDATSTFSSRFGSVASIGTSESSATSAFYSDVGSGHELGSDGSCHSRKGSGHFVTGLMSELNVSGIGSHEGSPVADVPRMTAGLKVHDGTSTYSSPSSTVSPGSVGSPGLNRSSELVFAMGKSDHAAYPDSSNVNSAPFYMGDNSSTSLSVSSESNLPLEFGSEYPFVQTDVSGIASHYNGNGSFAEHLNSAQYNQDSYHLSYSEGLDGNSVSTSHFL
ncbi:hypothetical protein D9758_001950 [Tetrapyrgos nigripes]|uniref:Homeobox domain-containing protein n=1 Tax=Tetrapyrgos nigripes TaxID=182062 RepID=A0A8H5LV92_9AGAR|nr:hypothetical protein D9758_001950 [Tetrapyrgos nigripes]